MSQWINGGNTEGTLMMKVSIKEWSEDEECHLVKNKAVEKIKMKAFNHDICKVVSKNFQTCDLLKPTIILWWWLYNKKQTTYIRSTYIAWQPAFLLATTNKEVPHFTMLPAHEIWHASFGVQLNTKINSKFHHCLTEAIGLNIFIFQSLL